MQHRSLFAAALVALAACAALEMPTSSLQAVDALVREALDSARSSPAQQKASLQRAEQAFGRDATALNRLRLALLLATLAPALRDDARAAELLEPIADPGAPGVGRFAALLAGQVGERARMARERERADRERDKREEALRQQLEALRAIERGIQEREEKLRRSDK
ncbi:MAG TPA: hypothetical protein VEV21_11055 [Burkholderiales bacterium]|nr:hypothetical protein [Burkholderiales bacterium]